jgi:hypothetical protein
MLPTKGAKDLLHPHKDRMPPQAAEDQDLEVKLHMQEGMDVQIGTEGSKA